MPSVSNDQDSSFYDENDGMPEDRYGNRSVDTSSFTSFDIAVDSSVDSFVDPYSDSCFKDPYDGRSNNSSYNLPEHSGFQIFHNLNATRGLIYYCSLGTRLVNVT